MGAVAQRTASSIAQRCYRHPYVWSLCCSLGKIPHGWNPNGNTIEITTRRRGHMRVLVTGAAGFIGQHMVKALTLEGHDVIGLDIKEQRPDLPEWIREDITKPLTPIGNLDAVIHLAAIAHPTECDADPPRTFRVNVYGTSQVLQLALKAGARKFIFASSAHVYDIPPKYLPTDEVHPLRLNNIYTTSKVLGEQLCELYWTNHGLSYTVLRLYNVFGPRQSLGYFVPDMIAKARVGDIKLGGGDTAKDFVYVSDVVRAMVLAAKSPFVGPVNIGTTLGTPLRDIAAYLAEKFERNFVDGTSQHIATRMQADITRAKEVLGWEPTVTVTEGLDRILQHEGIGVMA